jgi:hypothetical protein
MGAQMTEVISADFRSVLEVVEHVAASVGASAAVGSAASPAHAAAVLL